jgi:hypothetical protein
LITVKGRSRVHGYLRDSLIRGIPLVGFKSSGPHGRNIGLEVVPLPVAWMAALASLYSVVAEPGMRPSAGGGSDRHGRGIRGLTFQIITGKISRQRDRVRIGGLTLPDGSTPSKALHARGAGSTTQEGKK